MQGLPQARARRYRYETLVPLAVAKRNFPSSFAERLPVLLAFISEIDLGDPVALQRQMGNGDLIGTATPSVPMADDPRRLLDVV